MPAVYALGLGLAVLAFLGFLILQLRKKHLHILQEISSQKSLYEYSWAHLPTPSDPNSHLPVHYRLEGDSHKPLVILIHGLGANLNCWRRIFPLLKPHFQVLAFDLPGFGLTPDPNHYFAKSPDQLSPLIFELIESLKHKGPVHLIGNSMGGILSLSFMESYPNHVGKVFLINPALSRKLVRLRFYRWAFLAQPLSKILNRKMLGYLYSRTLSKPKDLELEVLNHLSRSYLQNPDGLRSFALYVKMIEEQGIPEVDYSKCLFLFSGGDKVITAPHRKRTEKFFPHAHTLFHPSGGHQLQEDEPEWLSEEIKKFILSS